MQRKNSLDLPLKKWKARTNSQIPMNLWTITERDSQVSILPVIKLKNFTKERRFLLQGRSSDQKKKHQQNNFNEWDSHWAFKPLRSKQTHKSQQKFLQKAVKNPYSYTDNTKTIDFYQKKLEIHLKRAASSLLYK